MSLVKIKQIDNTPAAPGAVILYDGTGNIWTNNSTGALQLSVGTTAQRTAPPTTGLIRFNTDISDLEWYDGADWVTATAERLKKRINQTAHGLTLGQFIRFDGTIYVPAQADNIVNAESIGVVSEVIGVDDFEVTMSGYVDLTGAGLAMVPGDVYFLDPTTAGAITVTEPSTAGQVSKPVIVADTADSGYVINYRGFLLAGTSGLNGAFRQSFTNADLTAGVVTFAHNFGEDWVSVTVFDENRQTVIPDTVESLNPNQVDVDLTTFGTISGTWNVLIVG